MQGRLGDRAGVRGALAMAVGRRPDLQYRCVPLPDGGRMLTYRLDIRATAAVAPLHGGPCPLADQRSPSSAMVPARSLQQGTERASLKKQHPAKPRGPRHRRRPERDRAATGKPRRGRLPGSRGARRRGGHQQGARIRPNSIVLDIIMPRKDGWQVLYELKADPSTRDIPIIVLSVVDQKNLGYRLGAADYLIKPFERETFAYGAVAHCRALWAAACGRRRSECGRHGPPAARGRVLYGRRRQGRAEALRAIAERPPDAVLLDLLMPGLDGFAVLEQLQADPGRRDIPVIVLTAKELTREESALLERARWLWSRSEGWSARAATGGAACPECGSAARTGKAAVEDPDHRGRRAQPRPARAAPGRRVRDPDGSRWSNRGRAGEARASRPDPHGPVAAGGGRLGGHTPPQGRGGDPCHPGNRAHRPRDAWRRGKGGACGCDDYLAKPIDEDRLFERFARHLA